MAAWWKALNSMLMKREGGFARLDEEDQRVREGLDMYEKI